MLRDDAFHMFARLRDERDASRYSISKIVERWDDLRPGPSDPDRRLTINDLRRTLQNVELTYSIRLFAVYEAVLRDFWLIGMNRKTIPVVARLMDGIASRRRIDTVVLADAHLVRAFRNSFMHANFSRASVDYKAARRNNLSNWLVRSNGVIPFAVELVSRDLHGV